MRRLNVKLFAALVLGSFLLVGVLLLVHWLQSDRIADGLQARAERAEQEGELAEAARYLGRYLEMEPDDIEARARLGKLLAHEKLATNARSRSRALFVLEQVLVKQPDAHELRFRLVRLALELRRQDVAREHLAVLAKAWPEHGDVAYHQGMLAEADSDWDAAARAYRRANTLAPREIDAYLRLADVLRRRLGQEDRNAREADEVMARLVENNSDQVSALLARWRYRRQWTDLADDPTKLEEAAADVRQALERAPDQADALLAAAELAQLQKKPEEARKFLQQGQTAFGTDARFVRDLASLELRENHRDQAIASLKEGIAKQRGEGKAELLWTLANILLDGRQVDEARPVMTELAKTNMTPAAGDYLQARIHMIQARWHEAAKLLERRRDLFAATPELARQTDLLLAQCHEHMSEPAMQLADYGRLVVRDSSSLQGRLGLAGSLVALGRHEDALEQYRRIVQLPGAPASAWIEMARLVMVRQLRRPKPDWTEVDTAMTQAGQHNANALELVVLKAQALTMRREFDQARQLLVEAQRVHPDRHETWLALAEIAERQEQADEIQRCLAEAERLGAGNAEAQAALVRFWSRRRGAEGDTALARVATGFDQHQPAAQARLLGELAQAYYRRDNLVEAKRYWERLSKLPDHQHDVRLRLILFEVAQQQGDDAAMQRWLAELQTIEGNQGTFLRYCTATRKIWQARQGQRGGLEEARALLDAVAADRPNWSVVPLAKADIEALRNNAEQAIAHYRQAIELGERSPRVVRQLVQFLYRQQRFDEAEQEIRRLQRQAPSNELQRLIVDIALRKQDPLQAAREALDAVSADSTDYRDHVWLGQVLALAGQQPEQAEKHLRKAAELGPEQPETWLALVQFLAVSGRQPEAAEIIAQAASKLPAERAALALAQCWEATGDLKRAEEQFQAFLAAAPAEVLRLRSLASFYLRTGRLSLAEPLLRKLMEDLKSSDATWARRSLAVALATSGDQRRAREAQQLVSQPSDDPLDRRAQARVMAAMPLKGQRQQAIQILEELGNQQTLPVEEQFLLAQLHDASGPAGWSKADPLLRQLTTNGNVPQHLAYYARALLRSQRLPEAERHIARLEAMEKQGRLRPGTAIELRLLLLEAGGQADQSMTIARAFAEADRSRPERLMVFLATLVRQKKHAELLAVWEHNKADQPAELFSGALVASLRGGSMKLEHSRPVLDWLEAAVAKSPQSLTLLLHLADLNDLCGRYGEAEKVYRQALTVDPDNVVTLNNLAWLLAQQPRQAEEALGMVNRAIDRYGPRAELLDTRASAYLALQRVEPAIADLEAANAEQPAASRWFLLAQAQRQANNTQKAADLLKQATAQGLKAEQLHPVERTAFLKLVQELQQR